MVGKVRHILVQILVFLIFLLVLVWAFQKAKLVGYEIFADQAKDSEQTMVEAVITVDKDEPLRKISKELEKKRIVKNGRIFAMSVRTMDGYDKIKSGRYRVDSSMKPSEILLVLTRTTSGD